MYERRGTLYCRCTASMGYDPAGEWTADLISPREHFPAARRLLGHLGLAGFRLARNLQLPVWRWLRLSSLAPLLTPNTARHVRVETHSIPFAAKGQK